MGPGGAKFLDEADLAEAYAIKLESLRDLIEVYDREVAMLDGKIAEWLKDDVGYWAIQAIPGSVRSWPPSSWLRSATSPGLLAPSSCARGAG